MKKSLKSPPLSAKIIIIAFVFIMMIRKRYPTIPERVASFILLACFIAFVFALIFDLVKRKRKERIEEDFNELADSDNEHIDTPDIT